ncbi:MAG: diguanylate cyclase [Rhodocyclales bacterium]|nr:diguanylate cyclase [Rhodocyclales bacterium]
MRDKSGTVLVIDDSPANAHQLFEVLGDDYHVLVATRGSDGIALAVAQNPDLILLDVVMPELSGYEVCARLKDDPRTQDIPLIFVTARDEEDDEAHGLSLGAIDYLAKPLRPAIVSARVKNHVELKRSRDLLQRLTLLDPLTDIANRRRFDEYLTQEWNRAARDQAPLALLMIDVDNFKGFNDRNGHARGDQCLSAIAHAIQSALQRPADLVARYGGEEFVCVLPGTDLAGAGQLAEHIRATVAALAVADGSATGSGHVSVSVGVAAARPQPETSSAVLIHAADQALYEAKLGGRNCVCLRQDAAPARPSPKPASNLFAIPSPTPPGAHHDL